MDGRRETLGRTSTQGLSRDEGRAPRSRKEMPKLVRAKVSGPASTFIPTRAMKNRPLASCHVQTLGICSPFVVVVNLQQWGYFFH